MQRCRITSVCTSGPERTLSDTSTLRKGCFILSPFIIDDDCCRKRVEVPPSSPPAKYQRINVSEPSSSPVVKHVRKDVRIIDILEEIDNSKEKAPIEIDFEETFVDDSKVLSMLVEMENDSVLTSYKSTTDAKRSEERQESSLVDKGTFASPIRSTCDSRPPTSLRREVPRISVWDCQKNAQSTPPGFWSVDSQ